MKAVFFIAKRYLFAKSSQNVINIINRITTFVVILGGISLFIVLAGFAGLKKFTVSFSSTFDPDLKILPKTGKFLSISENDTTQLKKMPEIVHFTKVLEEQVFLNHQQKNHIAYIKGVDNSYHLVNQVDSIIVLGGWHIAPPEVVTGVTIFNKLGLAFADPSSPLQIVVPKAGKGSITSEAKPYREVFSTVSGVYQITEELDKKFVFSSLIQAQHLLGLEENQVSAIEIKLVSQSVENQVVKEINSIFGNRVIIKNRQQLNDALYRMLNTENIAVYLIFILVLVIALFNLVGAIIMMFLDKKEDLSTLYALGLNQRQMKQVFFLQGTIISAVSAFIGVFFGAIIVSLQQYFSFVMISPTLSYPAEIEVVNVFIVFFTILALGMLASLIASSRVRVF